MSTDTTTASTTDDASSVGSLDEAAERLETDALPEPESSLDLDQVFEILKNQRRRYVLQYLSDVDDVVSMSDLAEEIAAWENGKEVAQLSSSERKRVYVGLYQCHLPKMDSMGVVKFNKPRGRIERGPNADLFDAYLETDTTEESPAWHRIHAMTAMASVVVLAVAMLAQTVIAGPIVALAGLLIVAGNGGASAAHFQWARRQAEDDDQTTEPTVEGGATSA